MRLGETTDMMDERIMNHSSTFNYQPTIKRGTTDGATILTLYDTLGGQKAASNSSTAVARPAGSTGVDGCCLTTMKSKMVLMTMLVRASMVMVMIAWWW